MSTNLAILGGSHCIHRLSMTPGLVESSAKKTYREQKKKERLHRPARFPVDTPDSGGFSSDNNNYPPVNKHRLWKISHLV